MYLPQTLSELRKISGFGDAKVQQYGQQFLDAIKKYSEERNLSSLIHNKIPKRERKERTGPPKKKGDTQAESFKLYQEGKPIADIAATRNLSVNTIETHLAKYILSGDIKIEELITKDKLAVIESAFEGFDGGSIIPIKQKLGDDISFGEIRLVMTSLGIVQDNL